MLIACSQQATFAFSDGRLSEVSRRPQHTVPIGRSRFQPKRRIHGRISISFAVRNLKSNRIAQLSSGISIAQENRCQCFFNRKSFKWIYRVWLYQSERIDIATWRGFSSMLLHFFLGVGFAEKI